MNNRKLSLLFIILFGVWSLFKYTSKDTIQSFKTDLISIDTAQVTIIKIDSKDLGEITLQRNTTFQWLATKGTVTAIVNRSVIDSVLNNIRLIKTKEVAAEKKEKWSAYKVDKTNGVRVKIYAGNQLLEDVMVGRFSYNEATQQGLSFVRIIGGAEVYAVDGFLSKNLGQEFDVYRDKNLVKIVKDDITALSLTKEDGVVQAFIKSNNHWTTDSVAVDSSIITNYLLDIQKVMGSKFVDDIDPSTYNIPKYRTLVIKGNNMPQPLTITCYRDEAKTPPYIIQSSQNSASYFSSKESDLFQKIFVALEVL